MELSTWPLSVAEPAFHSIAANYLSGSPQTDLSLSASCRTTKYVCMHSRTSDRLPGYMYFWSKYLLKCQIERSNSVLRFGNFLHFHQMVPFSITCRGRVVEEEGWKLQLKSCPSWTLKLLDKLDLVMALLQLQRDNMDKQPANIKTLSKSSW